MPGRVAGLPQPPLLFVGRRGGEGGGKGGLAGADGRLARAGPAGRLLADLHLQEGKYFTNLKLSKAPSRADNMFQDCVGGIAPSRYLNIDRRIWKGRRARRARGSRARRARRGGRCHVASNLRAGDGVAEKYKVLLQPDSVI